MARSARGAAGLCSAAAKQSDPRHHRLISRQALQQRPQSARAQSAPSASAQATPPEWSGEDGASGHPLMTAAAIREAAGNFDSCVAGMWPDAARRGISQASFERFTADLTPDLRIMDLMDAQPEFTKSVWDYLDILVTDARIASGREMLAKYKPQFDAVEKAYGVDRYIIAAIWGIEFELLHPDRRPQRAAVHRDAGLCRPPAEIFHATNFSSALEILNRGDLRPEQLRGSWAGAFGPTQFMPTAFKRYAVDFDHDGRRDVVDDAGDLIASTANNLKKDGWQSRPDLGLRGRGAAGLQLHARGSRQGHDHRAVAASRHQARRRRPFPQHATRPICWRPPAPQGPGFLMLQNFRVIMQYNPAEAYALAIGHFADRLRGGAPFIQPWPRDERVLSRDERLELQQLLVQRGFYHGDPTASSAAKPARRCAASRLLSARPPTALPRRMCWSSCGQGGCAPGNRRLLALALTPMIPCRSKSASDLPPHDP